MVLYTILFFATFPALWLLAAFLDRVWQPDSNRAARETHLKGVSDEARLAARRDYSL
jgi:hypothetical protein